jgi:hypothetical protein
MESHYADCHGVHVFIPLKVMVIRGFVTDQKQFDSRSPEVEPPKVNFSKVGQAPPEVPPVLVLAVWASVEEVNVAAGEEKRFKTLSSVYNKRYSLV